MNLSSIESILDLKKSTGSKIFSDKNTKVKNRGIIGKAAYKKYKEEEIQEIFSKFCIDKLAQYIQYNDDKEVIHIDSNKLPLEVLRVIKEFFLEASKEVINEQCSIEFPLIEGKFLIEYYDSREVRNPKRGTTFQAEPKVQVKWKTKRKTVKEINEGN